LRKKPKRVRREPISKRRTKAEKRSFCVGAGRRRPPMPWGGNGRREAAGKIGETKTDRKGKKATLGPTKST